MEIYSIVIVFSFESSQVVRAIYVLHEMMYKHLELKIVFKEESSTQSEEITFLSFSLSFFY